MSKRAYLCALATILGFGCEMAVAKEPLKDGDVVSVKVDYRDLDLSQPADAAIMLGRIKHAASEACGPTPDYDLAGRLQRRACLQTSLAAAVARLDRPMVTALAKPNRKAASTELAKNDR